jgi:hypothetical protein
LQLCGLLSLSHVLPLSVYFSVKYFVVKHFDRHSITWPICSKKKKKKKITWPIWSLKGEQKWQQLLVSVGSSRAAPSCRVEKKKITHRKKRK